MVDEKDFFIKVYSIKDHYSFIQSMFKHSRNFYINFITKQFGSHELTENLLFTIDLYCYGGADMMMKWVNKRMKESPDQLAYNFINNMPIQLKKYFEYDIEYRNSQLPNRIMPRI